MIILSDTLDSTLESLSKDLLRALIKLLLFENPELNETVLEWIKEKSLVSDSFQILEINDNLFKKYWKKARKIISDFNKYGGGPEDEEDKVISILEKMTDFVDINPISPHSHLQTVM